MKRQKAIFYGFGVATGVALMLLLGAVLFFAAPRPGLDAEGGAPAQTAGVSTPAAETGTGPSELFFMTPSPTVSPSAVPVPSAAPAASAYPAWEKGAVYVGGDKVLYENRIYRAKWWTQGEIPGGADVWEDTLETPAPPPSAVTTPKPAVSPKPEGGNAAGFKVVGYYPSWKPGEVSKLQYDVLTHVNYAFAIPTAEGGLRPLENEETARQIIASAHASGVKVLIAVGGWSYNDTPLEAAFMAATETEAKRAAFADAIVALCTRLGFDGVDMDWEHPRVDGGSAKQYEAFMLTLAEKLHGEGKLLTSAVLSGATADGNTYYDAAAHSDKVLAAVDWINVMAYDGGDGERHSSYEFAVNCGSYWKETRGMPSSKVVLGVPFYARPSWASYGDILASVSGAWQVDTVSFNGMSVWYNGVPTMEKKTQYAIDQLGGVMIWEVSQDSTDTDKSLLTAIGRTIQGK